jgi:hypothetical protein
MGMPPVPATLEVVVSPSSFYNTPFSKSRLHAITPSSVRPPSPSKIRDNEVFKALCSPLFQNRLALLFEL